MIRIFGFAAIAALTLSACAPSADSKFKDDCATLVTDPEAQENIADMKTDSAGFCACMVQLTDAKPDGDKALIQTTLAKVAAKMEETGEGAEEVVGPMMTAAMTQPGSPEMQAVTEGIQKVGRLIDDIEDAFEGGTCPA
jgi:hypothetical protein